ncbi:MAG: hypothetical protein J7494_07225 [Sphingobium sp.]|nr:hypothetical protein [Sphingobium sp.]
MFKLPLTAALLVAAVAAPVAAKEKTTFTYDGVQYAYTQTQVGESTVIKGVAQPGDAFYFVVRNGKVVGKANGIPVSFRVEDAKAPKGGVELLASR